MWRAMVLRRHFSHATTLHYHRSNVARRIKSLISTILKQKENIIMYQWLMFLCISGNSKMLLVSIHPLAPDIDAELFHLWDLWGVPSICNPFHLNQVNSQTLHFCHVPGSASAFHYLFGLTCSAHNMMLSEQVLLQSIPQPWHPHLHSSSAISFISTVRRASFQKAWSVRPSCFRFPHFTPPMKALQFLSVEECSFTSTEAGACCQFGDGIWGILESSVHMVQSALRMDLLRCGHEGSCF